MLIPIQRVLGSWVLLSAFASLKGVISAWPGPYPGPDFSALYAIGIGLSAAGLILQFATAAWLLTLRPARFVLAYATALLSLIAASPIAFVPTFGIDSAFLSTVLVIAGNVIFLVVLVAVHFCVRRRREIGVVSASIQLPIAVEGSTH